MFSSYKNMSTKQLKERLEDLEVSLYCDFVSEEDKFLVLSEIDEIEDYLKHNR